MGKNSKKLSKEQTVTNICNMRNREWMEETGRNKRSTNRMKEQSTTTGTQKGRNEQLVTSGIENGGTNNQ
jgi:hypothetical protein